MVHSEFFLKILKTLIEWFFNLNYY